MILSNPSTMWQPAEPLPEQPPVTVDQSAMSEPSAAAAAAASLLEIAVASAPRSLLASDAETRILTAPDML